MLEKDPTGLLERAVAQTGDLIERLSREQAGLPTPCTEFDLRTLVNHSVVDLNLFRTRLTGGQPASSDDDLIDDDWSGAYRAAGAALVNAWRERGIEGTLELRMGPMPATWAAGQHLMGVVIHTWDIAAAVGDTRALDPLLAEAALAWGRANLKPQFRGQAFAPEVPVPDTAPVYDRLAGFAGRNPHFANGPAAT